MSRSTKSRATKANAWTPSAPNTAPQQPADATAETAAPTAEKNPTWSTVTTNAAWANFAAHAAAGTVAQAAPVVVPAAAAPPADDKGKDDKEERGKGRPANAFPWGQPFPIPPSPGLVKDGSAEILELIDLLASRSAPLPQCDTRKYLHKILSTLIAGVLARPHPLGITRSLAANNATGSLIDIAETVDPVLSFLREPEGLTLIRNHLLRGAPKTQAEPAPWRPALNNTKLCNDIIAHTRTVGPAVQYVKAFCLVASVSPPTFEGLPTDNVWLSGDCESQVRAWAAQYINNIAALRDYLKICGNVVVA